MGSAISGLSFSLPASGFRMPFDLDASLVSLPVYCANGNVASLLDPLRELLMDEGYHMVLRASPSTQQPGAPTAGDSNLLPANQTFEDQISVPIGSYLIMVGSFAQDQSGNVYDNGFRTQWYDAGAQEYLSDSYVGQGNTSGHNTIVEVTAFNQFFGPANAINKGLFILPSPLSITSPGQLNVQVTNLLNVALNVDMTFIFACPNGNANNNASGSSLVKPARGRNSVNR